MEKKDRLFIGIYNDYYGSLLTEYQRRLIDGYYNLDMSLSELAQEHGITPQGVRDALKRAENSLEEFECKLRQVEKDKKLREFLQEIISAGGEAAKIAEKAMDILDS